MTRVFPSVPCPCFPIPLYRQRERQIIFFVEAKASVCTYPSAEFVYQSKSASGGQQEGERSARRNLTIFWMQAFHLSLQGPRLFTWRALLRRLIRWLTRCLLVNFIEIWETGNYLRKKNRKFSAFSASNMLHLNINKVQVYFSSVQLQDDALLKKLVPQYCSDDE